VNRGYKISIKNVERKTENKPDLNKEKEN